MRHLMPVLSLLLGACASTPAPLLVKTPVPVECKEETPARPVMPTEEISAKPAVDELLRAALAENERREGYEGKLRAALENCKAPIR